MNTQLKNDIVNTSASRLSGEKDRRYRTARFSLVIFYIAVACLLAFDAGMLIKAAIIGSTLYGLILASVSLCAELAGLLLLVLPKFHYDFTLHVGGVMLPVLFCLPVAGLAADCFTFFGRLDIILLVVRVVLAVTFFFLYMLRSFRAIRPIRIGLVACVAVFALAAFVVGFVVEEDLSAMTDYSVRYTYSENADGTIELTGFSRASASRKYTIPEEVNGKKVTSLGAGFADNIKGMSAVTLPASVRSIAATAFSANREIEEVIVQGELADFTFACGNTIRRVSFPNGVSNLATAISSTKASFDGVRIGIPDDHYNEIRLELFTMDCDIGMLAPLSEDVFCVNFTTNCGRYLDSILAETREEAISAAKETIAKTESYTYRVGTRDYVTGGWFTSSDFASGSHIGTEPEMQGNLLDLYMQWAPVYLLAFETGDWAFTEAFERASFSSLDEDFELPEAQLSDHTFCGWYLDESFASRLAAVDTDHAGDLHLYPKFLRNYSITYDWGKASPEEDVPEFYHEEMSFELPSPAVKGYTFDGWYRDAGFGGEPLRSILRGMTGELDLYAKFTPITYTLTFITDGGTPVDEKTYTVENEAIAFSEIVTSRKGFSFDGWLENGGTKTDTWDVGEARNATFTAQWKLAPFAAKLADVTVDTTYGTAVTLRPDLTEEGGWYVNDAEITYSYQWYRYDSSDWTLLTGKNGQELELRLVSESGRYKLSVTATYRKNNTQEVSSDGANEKTVSISPKAVAITWQAPADLVYNKQAKVPSATVGGLESGDSCTADIQLDSGNNIKAGEFTFKATSLDNGNYTLNGASGVTSDTYTILPKAVAITWQAPADLVYNKQAKVPAATVGGLESGDSCTADIQLDSGNNVNAGTFTYKASSLSNPDYTLDGASGITSATYTIAQKTVSIQWTPPQDLVKNGEPKVPSATVSNLEMEDDCRPVVRLTPGCDNVEAGTFTYEVTSLEGTNSSNYCLPDEGSRTSPVYTITQPSAARAIAYIPGQILPPRFLREDV